jgi:hypothetical protein
MSRGETLLVARPDAWVIFFPGQDPLGPLLCCYLEAAG